ncbi:IS200/IS605 family transposase [Crocinitomix catalasitica]|nr:IS200/IS605 family transposase [Crocinitomix catalasitica]
MSEHELKRHNKTLLLYHLVFPLKYRKRAITKEVGESLKDVCIGISDRYEVQFLEIGYESDHVHFLVQSVPNDSVSEMVRMIKSITAKHLFQIHPELRELLWSGKFWTSGYYANTVGQYASEEVIKKYVENQGMEKDYNKIHEDQLKLF